MPQIVFWATLEAFATTAKSTAKCLLGYFRDSCCHPKEHRKEQIKEQSNTPQNTAKCKKNAFWASILRCFAHFEVLYGKSTWKTSGMIFLRGPEIAKSIQSSIKAFVSSSKSFMQYPFELRNGPGIILRWSIIHSKIVSSDIYLQNSLKSHLIRLFKR